MSEELKPCPWKHLGGTHILRLKTNRGFTAINCECGARGPGNYTHESAIAAWNTRTPDPTALVRQLVEALDMYRGFAECVMKNTVIREMVTGFDEHKITKTQLRATLEALTAAQEAGYGQ